MRQPVSRRRRCSRASTRSTRRTCTKSCWLRRRLPRSPNPPADFKTRPSSPTELWAERRTSCRRTQRRRPERPRRKWARPAEEEGVGPICLRPVRLRRIRPVPDLAAAREAPTSTTILGVIFLRGKSKKQI